MTRPVAVGFGAVFGFAGVRLLRRVRARALLTGTPVTWTTARPERRHFAGAAVFGVGWAITDSCPAPIAGQLAQGAPWSVFTIAGVMLGIAVFFRRRAAVTQSAR